MESEEAKRIKIVNGEKWYYCDCGQKLCKLSGVKPNGAVILQCKRCKKQITIK